MKIFRAFLVGWACIALVACSEDSPQQSSSADSQPAVSAQVPQTDNPVPTGWGTGDVSVKLSPENPTAATRCLSITVQGTPGRSAVIWKINGEIVDSGTNSELCLDGYKRGDLITVEVGTADKGAQSSVAIANSPPQVVEISSTPEEIFAGRDVTVVPVAEDLDGDDIRFSYRWLINGQENPLLTDAVLPGSSFTKGDTLQVLIVPNDFYNDGPTYQSYPHSVPNAPPQITSQPPAEITSLEYRYQVVASDPDDTTFTYRLEESPDGMTIDLNTGLIEWSLVDAISGEHTIAILVSDPEGAKGAQEYRLTLSPSQ